MNNQLATTKRRDNGDTPFGDWIRCHPALTSRSGYDLEDWDRVHTRQYFWHQYMHAELMLIEEKQFNREMTDPQKDTLGVISQALRKSFSDPGFRVKRLYSGRPTQYTYFGYHLIQFERTSPKDGGIRIDRIPVTEQELLCFLQFDRRFMEERLRFTPQMVPVSEHPVYLLPKPKQRPRKSDHSDVPTLFNTTPVQQQSIEWEGTWNS